MKKNVYLMVALAMGTLLPQSLFASGRISFDSLMQNKRVQMARFQAEAEATFAAAAVAYTNTLATWAADTKSPRLQAAASAELERVATDPSPDTDASRNLPQRIVEAQQVWQQAVSQAEIDLKRRTGGLLKIHLRECQRVHDLLAQFDPENPQVNDILKEMDATRRQLAELKFSEASN